MARDIATLPDNGVIYEGDYYKQIPFHLYIKDQEVPGKDADGSGRVFDIRDYGAVPDGITLNTEAINKASEAVRDAGGGVLLVDGGWFVTGTVRIYDNTTLWITTDSALVASKNHDNFVDAFVILDNAENVSITGGGRIYGNGEYFVYLPLRQPRLEPLDKIKLPPILVDPMGYPVDTMRYEIRSRIRYAEDKYGNGLPKIKRPMYMVWANGCKNVEIHNIILEAAMDWNLCIDGCDDVKIWDVVINGNRHVANTDGIDVMGSENVDVRHCFISTADDGLCVKAPRVHDHDGLSTSDEGDTAAVKALRGTRHVHFSDCVVLSVANAFKIGTETYYDIEDITCEDCHFMLPDIFPGSCSGISIETADGSNIKDITVRNITMENVTCPLFICACKRNKFGYEDKNDLLRRFFGGTIDNVLVENIKAVDAEVPSIITGYRMTFDEVREYAKKENVDVLTVIDSCRTHEFERRIKRSSYDVCEEEAPLEYETIFGMNVTNVKVNNMDVKYRDDVEELNIFSHVYENISDYPENSAFGDVPAYGVYLRHTMNCALENVKVTPRSMNTRDRFHVED